MERSNIILLTDGEKHEAWGSLTEICKNHPDFSYDYIKKFDFPFEYKGWKFIKIPFRKKAV